MGKVLKIFTLGNVDNYFDEAQKNITKRLSSELSKIHNVRYDNAKRNVFNMSFWKNLNKFKPDIIHVFLRPTTFVLLYANIFKLFSWKSKIVISAFQPPLIIWGLDSLISYIQPDLFVTITNKLANHFEKFKCKVRVLPCGVDIHKFQPITDELRNQLRKKYGLPLDKFIVLHVGHSTKGRNLPLLKNISKNDNIQVVFVSSKSFNIENSLIEELLNSGCHVITDYLENIQEIYQLSDCYVFPTINESNSIGLPLSVLEAMACNIPIITTKFGALPELFGEDDSFLFFNGTDEDLCAKIKIIMKSASKINNRDKVLEFDWQNVTRKLEGIYLHLLSGQMK
ncbi:MAG: glycosyltransferase family 4 protein [Planctomycetia bacterium]|nr:glycosyltransferase family 4 protein [Planctomycetia bacterium]